MRSNTLVETDTQRQGAARGSRVIVRRAAPCRCVPLTANVKHHLMERFESLDQVLRAVAQGSTEFLAYDEHPPAVDDRGIFGNVPLIPVITWGSLSGVELLLRGGANINAVCEEGNTPLHHAIQMGEFAIARLLLAHGADRTIRNKEGKLAKELCWEGEWPSIFGASDA